MFDEPMHPQRGVPYPLGRPRRAPAPHRRQAAPPPVVGELTLSFETTLLPADPGLALTMLSAPAGSPGDAALRMLASWAATRQARSKV
jgi:hypothetical protein